MKEKINVLKCNHELEKKGDAPLERGKQKMAKVIGKHFSKNAEGKNVTTLHLADDFDLFYSDSTKGRGCEGQKVESVYVGTVDVSKIKVGMDVEIIYDKAITTSKGTFSPIKRVGILG